MTHARTICKIGQGKKCCRYLQLDGNGYRCQKLSPFMRNLINARIRTSTAKGDNCDGVPDNVDLLKEKVSQTQSAND